MSNLAISFACALIFFSVAAGCSKPSSDTTSTTSAAATASPFSGSCNTRKVTSMCSDESEKSNPMNLTKKECEVLKGTWSPTEHCPKDNVLATCTAPTSKVIYYYNENLKADDPASFKKACESVEHGVFTKL